MDSGSQINPRIEQWEGDEPILGDMVRTNRPDGREDKTYHLFRGEHIESTFALGDGHAKSRRAEELTVFFTNGWGTHWK